MNLLKIIFILLLIGVAAVFAEDETPPPPETPYPGASEEFSNPQTPATQEKVFLEKVEIKSSLVPKTAEEKKAARDHLKNQGLQKITRDGTYIYKVDKKSTSNMTSLRGGTFNSPSLYNNVLGKYYADIYGETYQMVLFFDYQWILLKMPIGKLNLKVGGGFSSAVGNGYFKNNPTLKAEEMYTFYIVPMTLAVTYYLQFFEKQIFIPYAEAGGDYYAFLEKRDDNKRTKYGGTPAAHFSGGLASEITALDSKTRNMIESEYGVSHMYLVGDYRVVVGSGKFDFSDSIASGGFMVEF